MKPAAVIAPEADSVLAATVEAVRAPVLSADAVTGCDEVIPATVTKPLTDICPVDRAVAVSAAADRLAPVIAPLADSVPILKSTAVTAADDVMPPTVIAPLALNDARLAAPDTVSASVLSEFAVRAAVLTPPAAVMAPDALKCPLANKLVAVTGWELVRPAAEAPPICALPADKFAVTGPPTNTDAASQHPVRSKHRPLRTRQNATGC